MKKIMLLTLALLVTPVSLFPHFKTIEECHNFSLQLLTSVSQGDLTIVQGLIDAGVNVNVHDKHGMTALHLALTPDKEEVLKALLKAGANSNIRSALGRTPLMEAALHGYLKTVVILVQAKALVDLQDNRGFTALMLAEMAGHKDIAAYLKLVQNSKLKNHS